MSKFNFSFRRSERRAFKHIAHGLIPAATIAPRPAVPRTPPPRSPNPSPERPRSALAAAILTSSLMGRTVAIPPARHRSYSESDCSHTDSQAGFEPYASTALYTRDQWPDPVASRPRMPSPQPDDDSYDDDEDDAELEIEENVERNESHVYQTLERQSRGPDVEAVYATPLKKASSHSHLDDDTDNSAFDTVSPLNTEEETEVEEGTTKKQPSPSASPSQARPLSYRGMASPDLKEDLSSQSPNSPTTSTPKRKTSMLKKSPVRVRERDNRSEANEVYRCAVELQQELVQGLRAHTQTLAAEKEVLERKCSEQSQQILQLQQQLTHSPRERNNSTGGISELLSLRQQAQELVDENDGLKMTVHRLNVELSRYQARFRPLTKEESSRNGGLPVKGPAPPWLLDMKYLSPLLMAYEDQLTERDKLLKSCEEEVKKLRACSEEVIQENQRLHTELSKRSSVSNKEWRQLQDQARLVLEENEVLIEQLELQHTKAKETHAKHTQEVCKVSKQLMLLEAEKQGLEAELQTAQKELHTLKVEFQKTSSTLKNSVSLLEHSSTTDKLKRQMEEEERMKSSEIDELQVHVSALQAEKRALLLEKTNLSTDVKHLESELELARQANRKAQRRTDLLKQQIEDSLEKELIAHQYLASVVTLAEKTTHERDQLIHMASCLEKDKQGVLTRIIEGTVRLGKLQEKVKVFKQQARAGVCALGRRLQEQEQDFAGKAASFQREIQHLQAQLRERQDQLHGALQQKRAAESELEVVWEAATRENQHLQSVVMGVSRADGSLSPVTVPPALGCTDLSPAWTLRLLDSLDQADRAPSTAPPPFSSRHNSGLPIPVQHSPVYESDNPASDESQKNGLGFYS
ncbi:centrosomal protein of 89 kDa isoform X1 [Astyanax mexicanus]|uniref:Centrosomal protein of 89 kDa isoform X1 n=1 Tax=Astyanax mexicanus TaxID=7994 RepID=A0A8T2KNW7_ASTMX|nr:centrosomal protein of 89 kDa isoform X1 [Astyanax mexicanus]